MDIQTSKIELAKIILNIENPDLIEKIRGLIINEPKDFWLGLTATEKEEIEFGIEQLDKGNRISFDEFMDKIS
ncbi:MAG: hypothetical protein K9J13_12815 [Saprospiraceae bacterium]|nr:hypothetical protein [Saprospiraceae bacterium]